ncbi:MAG TPA: DUF981 family protein [Thermoplasmata archaeon]|nr:DUF981 family protein [Thermoplasmata archaeon]
MFVDFLAFQQATLLIAAVLIGYVGVLAAFAMRRNDAAGVRSALRGAAVPIGALGSIATVLAIWAEMAWPLPGSYNILFTDVYLLFGVTLVVLAVSLASYSKLQYAGLFAFVSGGLAIAYGWSGYHLGMTKDPFETFLLYGAFGLVGLLSFPASVAVDHYLTHPESAVFAAPLATAHRRPSLAGATRAVQPVVPGGPSAASEPSAPRFFRVPLYINAAFVVFLVAIALAAIAALLYLDSTLPAHLHSAP